MVTLRRVEIATLATLTAAPVPLLGTWDALAETLTRPPLRVWKKTDVPLWAPIRLREGATSREARWVSHVTAAVIDVDGAPHSALGEAISRLATLGLAAVVHTSHGAALVHPTHTKFRVVVPLAEPCPAEAWRDAWTRIVAYLTPGRADPHCRDVSHVYYVPSCPPPEGCPPGWAPVAVRLPGVPLDLATVPAVPRGPEGGGLPRPTRSATLDDLRDLATRWRRAKDPHTRHLGRCASLVVEGSPYAGEGERDVTTFDLVRRCVEAAPEVKPETWAALFAPSLAIMGEGAPTPALVEAKAVAARRYLEERPPPEVAPTGHTIDDGIPWVVLSPVGGAFYVRSETGWHGPFTGDAIDVALRRHLAHAVSLGAVSLTREGGKPGPLSRQEIALRYALPLDVHEIEIGRETTIVEIGEDRKVRLLESCAPVRAPIERSPIVEEFLACFAGTGRARADLDTWLAVLPDTSDTLAALVLTGPREVGKSLFALACSRLWTETGPSKASTIVGDWNGGLLTCPLVFADEGLPHLRSGENVTTLLREILQARHHTIRRKYLPEVRAKGCVRLILAANDAKSVLKFEGVSMSPADLAAVAERFYHLEVSDRAGEWLRADRSRSVRVLAELPGHARWLHANLPRERQHRFWIEGTSDVMDQLAIRGGARSDVCRWIVSWLTRPPQFSSGGRKIGKSYCSDGKIFVNGRHVFETWESVLAGTPRPPLTYVTDALRILSGGWSRDGVWRISAPLLRAWISESGWDVDLEASIVAYELSTSAFKVPGVS